MLEVQHVVAHQVVQRRGLVRRVRLPRKLVQVVSLVLPMPDGAPTMTQPDYGLET